MIFHIYLIRFTGRIGISRDDIRDALQTDLSGTADHQYAVHIGIVLKIVVLDGHDRVDEIYDLLEALFLDVFEQRLLLVGEHQLVFVRLGTVFVGGEIGVPVSFRICEHLLVGGCRLLGTHAHSVKDSIVVACKRAFRKESRYGYERNVVVFLIRTLHCRAEFDSFVSALRTVAVIIIGIKRLKSRIDAISLVCKRTSHALLTGRPYALDRVGAGTEHADALRSCDGKRIVVVLEKYRSFLGHLDVQSFRGGLRLFHGSIIGIKITVLFHGAESSGMVIAGNKNAEHDGQYYCEDYRQKCEAFRHFPFFHLEKTS